MTVGQWKKESFPCLMGFSCGSNQRKMRGNVTKLEQDGSNNSYRRLFLNRPSIRLFLFGLRSQSVLRHDRKGKKTYKETWK